MVNYFPPLTSLVVSAAQMTNLEQQIFQAGMPVPALMEKAAITLAQRIQQLYPKSRRIGVLVGPGHNGGDALVVGRELHLAGAEVVICCPITQVKELTALHLNYARFLGIPIFKEIEALVSSDLILDGLFGFGLNRLVTGELAELVDQVNSWSIPVVSIDLPSGLHTDTGAVLGTAIQASHSLCLGLWKRAYFQDSALPYLGQVERIDFGVPAQALTESIPVALITPELIRSLLPIPRPLVTHKYRQGHLLLVCGSARYAGAAILTALGARASGVGMLSVAVPQSVKPQVLHHLPEALIIPCPETATGAIASFPGDLSFYDAIACGPGLTQEADIVVEQVLRSACPLLLDADGLNLVSCSRLQGRSAPTLITPHLGEFRRLFPRLNEGDRLTATLAASELSQCFVLLKGAKTAIATPTGKLWILPYSTPALARGGSGDVLSGLIGGLIPQVSSGEEALILGAWWHAQAALAATQERTELGVDAFTLTQYLAPTLSKFLILES